MEVKNVYKEIAEDLLYVLDRIKDNVNSNIVTDADKIDLVKLCLVDFSVKDADGKLRSASNLIDELLNGKF
ncbi:Hypothetical protein LCAKO_1436 [Lacticaseibacillus paracasei subsp. paracasei]|uniref:Uncharacterized protein n=1 Tax=Lacticaseibacillus paracasei subsp. paracasei TaxID=47714 RepID=A0AAP9HGG6_LACPA|nr:hypothetical protein [Lacticaseibacillus paracasei]QGV17961.1 Hypothetical protein LCAKO_1436 [Lacticaseibacillus paracasei subsp. paracasei]